MKKRRGIIGAGQLGAYLCQTAPGLNVETRVLSHDPASPGNSLATEFVVAPYDDIAAVKWLCERSDVVTFEFEDIPDETLEYLEQQAAVSVFPEPATIRMIKNKALQKTWLRDHRIPTSDFVVCSNGASDAELQQRFGDRYVQKAQTGGIDGQGVQIINRSSVADLWQQPSLVEAFVPHERELAVLVVRDSTGEIVSYPVVELRFCSETNVLLIANSPARVSADVETAARRLGEQVVTAMAGVEVFAIELFETTSGELLVNEISPRVHNSGHLTIEAHVTNQYEQHIRAVMGEKLGEATQKNPAAMTNLLYRATLDKFLDRPFSSWLEAENTYVHWYGKSAAREGRKMGHITATANSLDDAVRRVINMSKVLGHDMGEVA